MHRAHESQRQLAALVKSFFGTLSFIFIYDYVFIKCEKSENF